MKDQNLKTSPAPAKPPFKQRVTPHASAYKLSGNAKSGESMRSQSLRNGSGGCVSSSSSSPPSSAVKVRAKSTVMTGTKVRRSLALKSVEKCDELVKVSGGGLGRSRMVVEQCALPTRRNGEVSGEVNQRMHELEEKLLASENVIKDLRDELEQARALISQLHLLNKGLFADHDSAKPHISALTNTKTLVQVRKESSDESMTLKHNQKIIANGYRKVNMDVETQRGVPPISLAPPPPPPPLPPRSSVRRSVSTHQPPAIVELYRSLSKPEARKEASISNSSRGVTTNVHNSIVGEIQNRSTHLMAIKNDIETKGDFINNLINKVLVASYTDIEDVLQFVDWLDSELSSLADERSVLKHFPWPEKKADAMREAAIEYRDLKLLEIEILYYEVDAKMSCEFAQKKLAGLLDKSERSIQRLARLRSSVMASYRIYNIPTEWMLESGITSKIKHVSMKLANLYMKRVAMELHAMRSSDREYAQEALLVQGVHFAYRVHQFAGGLDSETLCAFDELRKSIPGHLVGSKELQSGSVLSS